MDFHAESILGKLPLFIASTQELASSINVWPVSFLFLILFGFTLLIIFCLRLCICYRNYGLRALSSNQLSFCSQFSSRTGLTRVQQSRSLKKCLIIRLILFLFSTASDVPFCIYSAFSRYYFESISYPLPSTSLSVKSLTTHIKVGNYYSIFSQPMLRLCSSFAKLVITLRLLSDFSSMLPTELQIKYDDSNNANKSILLLQAQVSSIAPKPSESITITSMSWVQGCQDLMVCLLIHSPFVQEFIVGQTLNEVLFLSSTLLRKRLLPVRYLPTMVITPIGPYSLDKKSIAYWVILKLQPWNWMRGMGTWLRLSQSAASDIIQISIITNPHSQYTPLINILTLSHKNDEKTVPTVIVAVHLQAHYYLRLDPQQADPLHAHLRGQQDLRLRRHQPTGPRAHPHHPQGQRHSHWHLQGLIATCIDSRVYAGEGSAYSPGAEAGAGVQAGHQRGAAGATDSRTCALAPDWRQADEMAAWMTPLC